MLVAVVMTVPLDLLFIPWTDDRFENGRDRRTLSYAVTELMMVVVAVRLLAPQLAHGVRRFAWRSASWPEESCSAPAGRFTMSRFPSRLPPAPIMYPVVLVVMRPFDEADSA